jgi:hypothetical protein
MSAKRENTARHRIEGNIRERYLTAHQTPRFKEHLSGRSYDRF